MCSAWSKKSSNNLKNLPWDQKKKCMGFRSRHISAIVGMCFVDDSESTSGLSFMKKEGNQHHCPLQYNHKFQLEKGGTSRFSLISHDRYLKREILIRFPDPKQYRLECPDEDIHSHMPLGIILLRNWCKIHSILMWIRFRAPSNSCMIQVHGTVSKARV